MWKWVVIFLMGVVGLTVFVHYQVEDYAASTGPLPASKTAETLEAVALEAGVPEAESRPEAKGLSIAEERLMNRVAPVKEAPLQGEILLQ